MTAPKLIRALASLTLAGISGLTYFGCNAGEGAPSSAQINAQDGPSPASYDREIMSLKAKFKDPVLREKAIREAVARHGFPVPKDEDAAGTAGTEGLPPLAKAAAASQMFEVKNFSGSVVTTLQYSKTLAPNERLTVTVDGTGATDAALVAYYYDGGPTDGYRIKVVGLVEDGFNSLDPSLDWINNTGAIRTVKVLLFAESGATRGTAKVAIRNESKNQGNYWDAAPVGGTLKIKNAVDPTPAPNCAWPPDASTIQGRITNGTASDNYSMQILAANLSRTGMWMTAKAAGKTMETVPVYGKFASLDSGFVLVYNPGTTLTTGPAKYNVTQTDRYDCIE